MRNQLDTVLEYEENSEIRVTACENYSDNLIINSEKAAYMKHKEVIDICKATQDIEDAKEEWELVSATSEFPNTEPVVTAPIAYEETMAFFRQKNMTYFLKYIKPVRERNKFDALLNFLVGPPKLKPMLMPDRDLIFAIAQCPFDTSDSVHVRVLQTIYKTLIGCEKDCPRYGNHWESIGFQGVDPGTDLRGVGFLGLIHLLNFLFDPKTSKLSREIAALSATKAQEFPFCVMGINITRIVLETMREEVLNKHCNKLKDVFLVTNNFYAGVFLHFYQIWKEEKKTIMDSGFVLEDLSLLAKKNPSFLLNKLTDYKTMSCQMQNMFSDIGGASLKPSAEML